MALVPDEILTSSATILKTLIRKREISPVDLVYSYLARIEKLNPRVNAFISVTRNDAIRSAQTLERNISDRQSSSPLFGLPYAIKDAFFSTNTVTTAGSTVLRSFIPTYNSTVIERLNSAGAILIGKLNMTEFGMGTGDHFPYGTPRNPWDLAKSPGFSSSGSGIATAASLCAFTIGEDTGGSVRIPASHCGVTGLRPSQGLVSRYGSIPISSSFDIAGPITKTAVDAAMVMDVIAGYDPQDLTTVSGSSTSYSSLIDNRPSVNRIGLIKEMMEEPYVNKEVSQGVNSSLQLFEDQGIKVEVCSLPASVDAMAIVTALCESEALRVHGSYLKSAPSEYGKLMRRRLLAAHLIPSSIYQQLLQIKNVLRQQIDAIFDTYKVLVCPTQLHPAPNILPLKDITTESQALNTYTLSRGPTGLAALFGCPAISIPCGFTVNRLPVGLQIIGKPFEDLMVMQLAHLFQQNSSWHTLLPDL